MGKAEEFLKKFREQREPGYIPIDTKGLKDPNQEIADWIDLRLKKGLEIDNDIYDDLVKLRDKLRKKEKSNG